MAVARSYLSTAYETAALSYFDHPNRSRFNGSEIQFRLLVTVEKAGHQVFHQLDNLKILTPCLTPRSPLSLSVYVTWWPRNTKGYGIHLYGQLSWTVSRSEASSLMSFKISITAPRITRLLGSTHWLDLCFRLNVSFFRTNGLKSLSEFAL